MRRLGSRPGHARLPLRGLRADRARSGSTGRHGTREAELDQLLRGERLVDLYAVVRQGLRISKASYSIKKLEDFYWGHTRTGDEAAVADAMRPSSSTSAGSVERRRPRSSTPSARYNEEDVRSTLDLHALAGGAAGRARRAGPRPAPAGASRSCGRSATRSAPRPRWPKQLRRRPGTTCWPGCVGWHRREERPGVVGLLPLRGARDPGARRGRHGHRCPGRAAVRARCPEQGGPGHLEGVALSLRATGLQDARRQVRRRRRHPRHRRQGARL